MAITTFDSDYNALKAIDSLLEIREKSGQEDNFLTIGEMELIKLALFNGGVFCNSIEEVIDCLYILETTGYIVLEKVDNQYLKLKRNYGK